MWVEFTDLHGRDILNGDSDQEKTTAKSGNKDVKNTSGPWSVSAREAQHLSHLRSSASLQSQFGKLQLEATVMLSVFARISLLSHQKVPWKTKWKPKISVEGSWLSPVKRQPLSSVCIGTTGFPGELVIPINTRVKERSRSFTLYLGVSSCMYAKHRKLTRGPHWSW